jgi:hypothetical protein
MADGGRLAPLIGSAPRPWPLRDVGECAFPVAGSGALTQSCCLPVEPGEGYCRGHLVILRSGAAIGA